MSIYLAFEWVRTPIVFFFNGGNDGRKESNNLRVFLDQEIRNKIK